MTNSKMNGLYIHIPFCKKRCIYCDFYSTTFGTNERAKFVKALCNELALRRGYLPSCILDSIYIGGGTPSQLSIVELEYIFNAIKKNYIIQPNAEVTLEVNPDDVTSELIYHLSSLPVNRLSMGIQTFNNDLLCLLNRRHTSEDALHAVDAIVKGGFLNLSIDLIYGLPGQNLEDWRRDLRIAFSLPITHLSAYSLIYEDGTLLSKMRDEGKVAEVDEDLSLKMFDLLMDEADSHGYEHYEISNFCKHGYRARHNTGYWKGMTYLGCGPSAHSYNGISRRWNLSNLKAYITGYGDTDRLKLFGEEYLSIQTKYNEALMTALRTSDGVNLDRFKEYFGDQSERELLQHAKKFLDTGLLQIDCSGKFLKLTKKGIFVSDGIMSDLMFIDD